MTKRLALTLLMLSLAAFAPGSAGAEEDPFTVSPDATVEQLVTQIDKIFQFQPETTEQFLAFRTKGPQALQAAAKRILALEKKPESAAWKLAKKVQLAGQARGAAKMSADKQKQWIAEAVALIDTANFQQADGHLIGSVVSVLDGLNDALAAEAYKAFAAKLAKSEDEELRGAAKSFEGNARRLELVGKEMPLVGTTHAGEKFDLKTLRGKVVLLDFWATWCGPCLAELPKMRKHYEQLNKEGFEIVGLSLDENRADLDDFMAKEKLPWTILHEPGRTHPAVEHYGIDGIPAMFLIDREGKVLSVQARGEVLEELLKAQFPKK